MSTESTRKRILARIQTLLNSISDIKYTEINRMTVVDTDRVPFPCVFIFSGREDRLEDDRACIGYENWDWKVHLEFWGENVDLEEMLKKIHDTIFTDYRLGGDAVEAVRTGVEMWGIDPARNLVAMIIDYRVVYRHALGQM
jgi:hypothetical protein